MALDFCKEYDDIDLWNILFDESLDKPEAMAKILNGVVGKFN